MKPNTGTLKRMNHVKRIVRKSLRMAGVARPIERGRLNYLLNSRDGLLIERDALVASIGKHSGKRRRAIENSQKYGADFRAAGIHIDSEVLLNEIDKENEMSVARLKRMTKKDLPMSRSMIREEKEARKVGKIGRKRWKLAGKEARRRTKKFQELRRASAESGN